MFKDFVKMYVPKYLVGGGGGGGGGLQILAPWGTAIFSDSLPIKSRKKFTRNGMYTSATQASPVHGITDTD